MDTAIDALKRVARNIGGAYTCMAEHVTQGDFRFSPEVFSIAGVDYDITRPLSPGPMGQLERFPIMMHAFLSAFVRYPEMAEVVDSFTGAERVFWHSQMDTLDGTKVDKRDIRYAPFYGTYSPEYVTHIDDILKDSKGRPDILMLGAMCPNSLNQVKAFVSPYRGNVYVAEKDQEFFDLCDVAGIRYDGVCGNIETVSIPPYDIAIGDPLNESLENVEGDLVLESAVTLLNNITSQKKNNGVVIVVAYKDPRIDALMLESTAISKELEMDVQISPFARHTRIYPSFEQLKNPMRLDSIVSECDYTLVAR